MIGADIGSRSLSLQPRTTDDSGWVFWITGLAGAGKTTIARSFFTVLMRNYPCSVLLDGEDLRRAIMPEAGYSPPERLECARRYGLICKLLAEQGLNVVIATISMFEECRNWNRAHLSHYFEVYVHAPMEVLIKRDRKGLYRGQSGTGATMVMGKDLPCECPANPDIRINNDGARTPEEIAGLLWRQALARMTEIKGER